MTTINETDALSLAANMAEAVLVNLTNSANEGLSKFLHVAGKYNALSATGIGVLEVVRTNPMEESNVDVEIKLAGVVVASASQVALTSISTTLVPALGAAIATPGFAGAVAAAGLALALSLA